MLSYKLRLRRHLKGMAKSQTLYLLAFVSFLIVGPIVPCWGKTPKEAFKKYLEAVTSASPKLRAQKLRLLSEKSEQWGPLLATTPNVSLNSRDPVRKWGTEGQRASDLSVSLNLFRSGYDVWRGLGANQAQEKIDLQIQVSEINFQAEVARVLFAWLAESRQLQSLKVLLESKRELLRVAQLRYRKGLLAEQEVDKVQVEFANTEIQLGQVEVQHLKSQAQLTAFLGDFDLVSSWPWADVEVQGPRFLPEAKNTKTHKIYDLEADYQLNLSRAQVSQWLPRLDLNSKLIFSEPIPFRSTGEWSSYLTATWELWDGGATMSAQKIHRELYDSAQATLQDFELRWSAQNKVRLAITEKLQKNFKAAQKSAAQSRKLVQDSIRRFELGRSSVNDLIIDQSRAYSAELLAQESAKDYHLHLLELCLGVDVLPSACF